MPIGGQTLGTRELNQNRDLCAVDGVVYDIAGFSLVHPGGDKVIRAAGGTDASALFHSMHPLHLDPSKSRLLQQYRIGNFCPKSGEHPVIIPQYTFQSEFATDLKTRVRRVMGSTKWFAPPQFWIRSTVILLLTVWSEYQWIIHGTMFYGLAVGVIHACIGLSIQHDASHGAISTSPFVNEVLAYGADLIGNSRWIWFQQHILWHHPYTNHIGLDGDAQSAEPALLFHDYSTKMPQGGWWHRFQHIYMHTVLALYGPSMTLNYGYLRQLRHNQNVPDALFAPGGFFREQRAKAIVFRCLYFLRTMLLPWYIASVPLLVGLVFVPLVCGSVLTLLFVVSHNFEGSDREPYASCSKEGKIDWYKAQVETSSSYGGWLSMVLTGGLNLQIEHHCFPRMSSWHYPAIQQVVRECCKDHGVRYVYFPDLWSNLRSTWRYMRRVGVAQVIRHAQEH